MPFTSKIISTDSTLSTKLIRICSSGKSFKLTNVSCDCIEQFMSEAYIHIKNTLQPIILQRSNYINVKIFFEAIFGYHFCWDSIYNSYHMIAHATEKQWISNSSDIDEAYSFISQKVRNSILSDPPPPPPTNGKEDRFTIDVEIYDLDDTLSHLSI